MSDPRSAADTGHGWGLPRRCTLCRAWQAALLCADCLGRFAPALHRCPRCALPAPGGAVCGACLRQPPAFTQAWAAVDYGFPWDGLITRFKFQGEPELARDLAALMLTARATPGVDGPGSDEVVVPVPLAAGRLAERGYNQAWELAWRLARARGLPAQRDSLLRLRDTGHQVGLSRAQRLRNLSEAFWVPPPAVARLQGREVVLVDDVLTTGVTATAATQTLLAAGVRAVRVWVLARTLPPADD